MEHEAVVFSGYLQYGYDLWGCSWECAIYIAAAQSAQCSFHEIFYVELPDNKAVSNV